MSAPAGAVDVAHSRALGVGGNRGIMRKSTISSGHGLAPMCADPPHRTWEPDRHTQLSPENPVIPTKNSYIPVEAPVSHVQHRRQPHLPNTASDARLQRTSGDLPSPGEVLANTAADALTPRTPRRDQSKDRSRAGVRPISSRNATDLGAEADRSRAGVRPISAKGVERRGRSGEGPGGSPGGKYPPSHPCAAMKTSAPSSTSRPRENGAAFLRISASFPGAWTAVVTTARFCGETILPRPPPGRFSRLMTVKRPVPTPRQRRRASTI